ncbi:P-loop containing nucleoside triphosphate hydrolase protein [Hesseltinella vesiculosa]|uniref:P-loop containing nucleoside triphosphate hydrolase protein n=1 Tax=Hesseltinella vesiculosa TaxID=101127 RepID=A0A1X2GMA2_9FUNG|nr:P-loop containing nucleoside triphosphate hydrolase protein [Hesseltinella vesiculosa]
MPPKGKKGSSSLGRAVIKSRFQGHKAIALDEGKLHTTELHEGDDWMKMRSITQENDLEAFLSTAQLAGTEFTAERLNVKVVQDSYNNPFLSLDKEEQLRLEKQEASVDRLTVPRRPQWDKSMTADQLHRKERESFLDWRRGMAQLEDDEGLLLTPYEKNLEVWRQLWRVIERSSLIVQIVDARNPLLFRSADVEKYVKEIDPRKNNLLLINKADLLSDDQRTQWADHFDKVGIQYTFFSAKAAATAQEALRQQQEQEELQSSGDDDDDDTSEDEDGYDSEDDQEIQNDQTDTAAEDEQPKDDTADLVDSLATTTLQDERIRIRTTANLLELLIDQTPDIHDSEDETEEGEQRERKTIIGLVGYPNVGKSSTINALIGEKCVSVSSTPGKTKHFQTIHLSSDLILCDCPGLVFPTFSTTKADQVCNGVLPIDQLRDHTGPTALVARRIPQPVLEATYGIKIRTMPIEDGGSGVPTSAELCSTYAIARGYFRSSQGNPDEARAARYILKDYVNGKLLYCHPPPDTESDVFNRENHAKAMEIQKKAAPVTRVPAHAANYVAPAAGSKLIAGSRTEAVDKAFFQKHTAAPRITGKYAQMMPNGFNRVNLFPHQQRVAEDGTIIPQSRRERLAMVQQNLADAGVAPGKKRKKGKKNVKQRSGAGYDYM